VLFKVGRGMRDRDIKRQLSLSSVIMEAELIIDSDLKRGEAS
jgi:hypothetical protein